MKRLIGTTNPEVLGSFTPPDMALEPISFGPYRFRYYDRNRLDSEDGCPVGHGVTADEARADYEDRSST